MNQSLNPANCPTCKTEMPDDARFCGECGSPMREGIQRPRTAHDIRLSIEKGRNTRNIRGGQRILMWIAAVNLVGGLLIYFLYKPETHSLTSVSFEGSKSVSIQLEPDDPHWGAQCFLNFGLPGLIFLGLFVWARVNPLPATIAGLIAYVTFTIYAIAFPQSATNPVTWAVWLVRITMVLLLAEAIKSAARERRIQQMQEGEADSGAKEQSAPF